MRSKGDWQTISERAVEEIEREDGLTFATPPENRGQIVTRSYAGYPRGVIQRTHDASDGSVSYRVRSWRDDDEETVGLNWDAE